MAESGLPGYLSNWTDTALWKVLRGKDSAEIAPVVTTLNNFMPDIQRVLAQGGTAQTDFTLHDSQHAFRVAERMAVLIPSDVLPNLSAYELALLLFSAYLHDIGMTPEQHNVSAHYSYLLTGNSAASDLSEADVNELQKWLDDAGYDIVPPLLKEQPTPEILRLANELITHYCRHRHNDWSETWIRKNLTGQKLGTYNNWIEDLVALCRSHHQDYNDLIEKRFDPRFVGAPAFVVHLRYLAVALRVADILEFDPERTPDVILRHRNISPGSLIYWWKDHSISIVQENNRLLVSARPENAQLHHAIETMASDVDRELRLSKMLADVTYFEKCPGSSEKLPHRWDLSASLHRDIKPEEGAYEYIDGAFRPDTKRLLELLSGVELYGNPLTAVRELLQNGFDAVKEQIAYQRLAQRNPGDPRVEQTVAKLLHVELKFERLDDGYWLTCVDTGVGMSKAIIRDHLLVSGTARRHDILELERRCKEKNFSLGRTGQFGIGVLSYFMLADRITILTQRCQEAGDSEGHAWSFATEGIEHFGELRSEPTRQRGTEVRLHLRSAQIEKSPENWYQKLSEYLRANLVYLPCHLSVESNLSNCPKIGHDSGWVLQSADTEAIISEDVESAVMGPRDRLQDRTPDHLLPSTKRQEQEGRQRHFEEVFSEVRHCLRWVTMEGQFPNGFGLFRFHIPYFELHAGKSLAFLRCIEQKGKTEISLNPIGKGYAYIPGRYRRLPFKVAWKGVRVGTVERSRGSVVVETNWHSSEAGKIRVNRDEFVFSEKGKQTLIWLEKQIYASIHKLLRANEASQYAALSYAIAETEASPKSPVNWFEIGKVEGINDVRAVWKAVKFPAISSMAFIYGEIPHRPILWKKRRVSTMRCLGESGDTKHYEGLSWSRSGISPDRVVESIASFGSMSLVGLWTRRSGARPVTVASGHACSFPPKWKTLCGARFEHFAGSRDGRTFWNPRHRLVSLIDEKSWQWCKDRFRTTLDPLPQKESLLANKSSAAAWVVSVIERAEKDLWEGLVEREPQFLLLVWESLFGVTWMAKNEAVCFWIEESTDTRLRVVSPVSWKVYKPSYKDSEDNQIIRRYLPNPGSEWRLRFEGSERKEVERWVRKITIAQQKRKSS